MDGWSSSRGSEPRLSYLDRSIPERIDDVQQAIEAYAENKDLREALAEKNVKQDRVDALAALLAPVLGAVADIDTAARGVKKATTAQKKAVEEAEKLYAGVAADAEAAFRKDRPARVALGLLGHETSQVDRFAQMRKLYDGAADYDAQLTDYGVKPEQLAAGRAALDAAEKAVRAADRRAVAKQDATDARDRLLVPLDDAFRDFQERAATALRDRPQLLELLGLRPK